MSSRSASSRSASNSSSRSFKQTTVGDLERMYKNLKFDETKSYTLGELQFLCKKNKLSSTGNRKTLHNRLAKALGDSDNESDSESESDSSSGSDSETDSDSGSDSD